MSNILDKPDDIPQAVWDQAWGLACDSEAVKVPYYAMGDELTVARKLDALYIARAIMAAKAEEREAIAQMADARADLFDGHAMRCVNELDIVEARGAESAIKQFAAHLRGEG